MAEVAEMAKAVMVLVLEEEVEEARERREGVVIVRKRGGRETVDQI